MALWADKHNHSFALEIRHIVGFAIFLQVSGESCEKKFPLLFEDDGPSAEEDIGLYFVAVFEELLRMFELEVIVVIIGLRSESYLLDLLLFLVLLRLFLLFLLCIEELLVVHDSADRRVRRRSDLFIGRSEL